MLYSSHLWCHISNFSISSVIGTHRLDLTDLPWNFDRKPGRSHLNIPKLVVFDNQMNHLYSNSSISIFPLLILLRIWIISWRIHFLFVILVFFAFKCLSIWLICYLMRIFQYLSAFCWHAENSKLTLTKTIYFLGMVIGSNVY